MLKHKQKTDWKKVNEYCAEIYPKLKQGIENRLPNFEFIVPYIILSEGEIYIGFSFKDIPNIPNIPNIPVTRNNSNELKSNLKSIALIVNEKAEKYNLRVLSVKTSSGERESFCGYKLKPRYQEFAIK